MTTKTSTKKTRQPATKAVATAKASKPSLLPDADAQPDWDEYAATCETIRMVTTVLDREAAQEATTKWEEMWNQLSNVQQARAAFFLTFATASSLTQFGTDPRANLRTIASYWLLPDELFPKSDGDAGYAPTARTGTDG